MTGFPVILISFHAQYVPNSFQNALPRNVLQDLEAVLGYLALRLRQRELYSCPVTLLAL